MGGRHDPALLLVLGHVGLLLVHTRSLAAPGREAFPGEITAGLFAHLASLAPKSKRVNDERGRHLLSPLDPSPKALASLGFALPAQAPASAAFCDPTSK